MNQNILSKFASGKFQLGYITDLNCDICTMSPFFQQAVASTDPREGFLLNLCAKCEMETSFQRKELQEKFNSSMEVSTVNYALSVLRQFLKRFVS